jgi:hypothetical protein
MAFKWKLVGNLVFNQEDGEIIHARTAETLAKFASKFVVPVTLLAKSATLAIDSSGVAEFCGNQTLDPELIEQASKAYFEASAAAPSATDAVVDVELYDNTTGEVIAKVTFSGDYGLKKTADILSLLKGREGNEIAVRINVITASATAGATQVFRSAVLKVIYDFT